MNILATLLTQVPLLYRWLMILGLIVAVFGFGYLKGYQHEEAKLATFEAQTAAVGSAQTAYTKKVDARALQLTKDRDHEHEVASVALAKSIAAGWVPRIHPGSGTVSCVSIDPGFARQGTGDLVPLAAGATPWVASDTVSAPEVCRPVIAECEQTTLDFIDLRNAWRDQMELRIKD